MERRRRLSILSVLLMLTSFSIVSQTLVSSQEVYAAAPTRLPLRSKITPENADQLQKLSVLEGPNYQITGISFNPVNSILAGIDYSGAIYLWEPLSGHLLSKFSFGFQELGASNIRFNHDGTLLASSGVVRDTLNNSVFLWDLRNPLTIVAPRPSAVLDGHKYIVRRVAFSSDGKLLASRGDDGDVILWDIPTEKRLTIFNLSCEGPGSLAISSNGILLADECGAYQLWDIKTYREIARSNGGNAAAFSPDGSLLAFENDYQIEVRSLPSFRKVQSLDSENFGYMIGSIAFSPDGRILAAGGAWYYIVLWEVSTGKKLAVLDTGAISDLAFSPDGTMLVSGHYAASKQEWVRIWGIP